MSRTRRNSIKDLSTSCNSIKNPSNGYNVQEFYDPNGKIVCSRHWCDIPSEGKNNGISYLSEP